ncbi:MAG: hypothetical protein M3417_00855 [Actinomycetota bacterium]|nr:hypothetical protein [Actinomycetota bacterium]
MKGSRAAIMAAGALLRDSGATEALDGGSWSAAYAYYGHDLFGVGYASQVVGRARGWERDGFCPNCPLDTTFVAAFDDAYGVDARRELRAAERRERQEKRKKRGGKATKKASEKTGRREVPRGSSGRESARPARTSTQTRTTSTPRPSTTTAPPPAATTPSPATTTEAPPQPTTPPPPPDEGTCTPLSSLVGCRD